MNKKLKQAIELFHLRQGKKLLAFDYDGTLAPPVVDPKDLTLHRIVSEELNRLLQCENYYVAIASGRSIDSLREFLGERKHLILAGDHGVHIEANDFSYLHPYAKEYAKDMPEIISILINKLEGIPGIRFELKPYSSAVVFRGVAPIYYARIIDTIHDVVSNYTTIKLLDSQVVFEICPNVDWHKGRAIELMAQYYQIPLENILFVGDAENDELGFRYLPTSCTIRVGDEDTAARFNIASQEDIEGLLALL